MRGLRGHLKNLMDVEEDHGGVQIGVTYQASIHSGLLFPFRKKEISSSLSAQRVQCPDIPGSGK